MLTNPIIKIIIVHGLHGVWLYCLAMDKKHSRLFSALICAAMAFITAAPCIYCEVTGNDNMLISSVLYIFTALVTFSVYVFILSAWQKMKSAFVYAVYVSLWTFMTQIAELIANDFFTPVSPALWIVRLILNTAFLLLFLFVLRDKFLKISANLEQGYGMLFVVSILIFFLLTQILTYNAFTDEHGYISYTLTIDAFTAGAAVYALLFRFIAHLNERYLYEQIKMQNALLCERLDLYERSELEAKRMRHDFRHHNLMVLEYAKNGDMDAIIKYLSEYEEEQEKKIETVFSANRTINNIVSAYASRAAARGIDFDADIIASAHNSIKDTDMAVMLANVLENAVNGCMQAEKDRRIRLKISEKGLKLIIVCQNTCAPDLTTDNIERGIGLTSLSATAEKYGGDVILSAENGMFSCNIILND